MNSWTWTLLTLLFATWETMNSRVFPTSEAFSLDAATRLRPFALNLRLTVRPDTRDTFLSVIQNDQTKTLTEELGALQFVFGEDIDAPNTFYLHEQYATKEAFDTHCQQPHFETWQQFCDSNPWAEGGEPAVDFFWGEHSPVKVPVKAAFCLHVDLFVKPERRDEFLKVIVNNKKGSDENEPLCLQYVYGEDIDVPNTFHFHEEYTGADEGNEGFEAHKSSPHFSAWEAFANSDPFTKPPVVKFYKTEKDLLSFKTDIS